MPGSRSRCRAPTSTISPTLRLEHWHTAYEHGVVKVGGDPAVIRLLGGVIAKHEARSKFKHVK